MFGKLQFAAVMLMLALLSAPLLPAVTCVTGTSTAAMHCPACKHTTDASLGMHRATGSCCDVSQAKPAPAAVIDSPVRIAATAPQRSSATAEVTPAAMHTRRQQMHSLQLPESPQSVLCTFLI
jgi:hypothetical protein